MKSHIKEFMFSFGILCICMVILGPILGGLLGVKLWSAGSGDNNIEGGEINVS